MQARAFGHRCECIEGRTGPRISKIRIGCIKLMGVSRGLLVSPTCRPCKITASRNRTCRGLTFDSAIRTSVSLCTTVETCRGSLLIYGLHLDRGSRGSKTLSWTAYCIMAFLAARIKCYIGRLTRNTERQPK